MGYKFNNPCVYVPHVRGQSDRFVVENFGCWNFKEASSKWLGDIIRERHIYFYLRKEIDRRRTAS